MRRDAPALLRFTTLVGLLTLAGCQPAPIQTAAGSGPAEYVGSAACARCHEVEAEAWRDSHHDLAMQPASAESVLGDFDAASFTSHGTTTTFSRRGSDFIVRTDGADGELAEFPVAYTFGVEPLQQYLIPFPGGRYQALGVAWDARSTEEGGQRWFHLYPDQEVETGDRLHWTSPDQTWNYQCADCHSTDLVRGYDPATDSYQTTFEEINVGCEACHGPGSRHVSWGEQEDPSGNPQLVVDLARADGAWTWAGATDGIARWQGEAPDSGWLNTCAPCHSRRRSIADDPDPTADWLDQYDPALLRQGLYHADGQILDEVYVWGSFVQSKMFAAGVRCDDCHDPHSTALRAEGNAVCASCHLPTVFETEQHLRHAAGTPGSQCVDCHAPSRTYMVVDPRRDHSFRVPRPDLAEATGAPDACTGCHQDRDATWAAGKVIDWYGPERRQPEAFGVALAAGRSGAVDAEARLGSLILDASQPAIVRATALELFSDYLSPASGDAVETSMRDPDPLVRSAAMDSIAQLPPENRVEIGASALSDPSRLVRIAAARAFADVPAEVLGDAQTVFEVAFADAVEAEMATAERPESRINLSALYIARGDLTAAERELHTALDLDPNSVAARVNLADLRRAQSRNVEAEKLLKEAVALEPDNAVAIHALGLHEVRSGRSEQALSLLQQARNLAPENTRFRYVYAVALHSAGRVDEAITELEAAHADRPADRDVLSTLASLEEANGNTDRALDWVRKLAGQLPGDIQVQSWIRRLGG